MAKITNDGIKLLENELKEIKKGLRGECMTVMLNAGADVLIENWRQSIQSHGHVKTGAMYQAVGKTEIQSTGDGMSIAVYPQGTDSHRVNNAQKAYILHYGREGKRKIKGDKFVTDAETATQQKVDAVMQAVMDQYISGKDK